MALTSYKGKIKVRSLVENARIKLLLHLEEFTDHLPIISYHKSARDQCSATLRKFDEDPGRGVLANFQSKGYEYRIRLSNPAMRQMQINRAPDSRAT
jgi:hypothetical protein